MQVKEWAGVLAKLQISNGRIQCAWLKLFDKWPGPEGYREWWGTMFAIDGDHSMRRLKFAIHRNTPELIPFIKDWDKYPPKLP